LYSLVNTVRHNIGFNLLGSVYTLYCCCFWPRSDRKSNSAGGGDALHLHVGGAAAVDSLCRIDLRGGCWPVGYLNSILSFHSAATLILAFGSSKLCARSAHVPECVYTCDYYYIYIYNKVYIYIQVYSMYTIL